MLELQRLRIKQQIFFAVTPVRCNFQTVSPGISKTKLPQQFFLLSRQCVATFKLSALESRRQSCHFFHSTPSRRVREPHQAAMANQDSKQASRQEAAVATQDSRHEAAVTRQSARSRRSKTVGTKPPCQRQDSRHEAAVSKRQSANSRRINKTVGTKPPQKKKTCSRQSARSRRKIISSRQSARSRRKKKKIMFKAVGT